MTYIAKVPVTVHSAGKRTVLPPGAELPELEAADIASLVRLKAIETAPAAPATQGEEPKVSTAKGAKK
ncbi:MAG: hypothetical protein LBL48_03820 [Azoarcus sp.]|jgi:hypothetical protein|nr:hypothetical protein [Azoarcus sp.]